MPSFFILSLRVPGLIPRSAAPLSPWTFPPAIIRSAFAAGHAPYAAIDLAQLSGEACQQCLRQILLTTAATVGGMLPLWISHDPIFETMAVSILFGLPFATLLTLVIVPVLYTILFKVKRDKSVGPALNSRSNHGGSTCCPNACGGIPEARSARSGELPSLILNLHSGMEWDYMPPHGRITSFISHTGEGCIRKAP